MEKLDTTLFKKFKQCCNKNKNDAAVLSISIEHLNKLQEKTWIP